MIIAGDGRRTSFLIVMSPFLVDCEARLPLVPAAFSASEELLRCSYTDQNRLEVLPRAPAGPAVHVALESIREPQTAAAEDLRIEVAAIVDDDEHRRARDQPFRASPEHGRHAGHVGVDG